MRERERDVEPARWLRLPEVEGRGVAGGDSHMGSPLATEESFSTGPRLGRSVSHVLFLTSRDCQRRIDGVIIV